ncbi:MAG: hypothetical protein ACRD0K_14560 [Egibacteraceae bacterium]
MREHSAAEAADIVPAVSYAGRASTETLTDADAEAIQHSKAENKWRAYRSDWAHFEAWREREDRGALPATPYTVTAYVHRPGRPHQVGAEGKTAPRSAYDQG